MKLEKGFWGFSAKNIAYIVIIAVLCFFGYNIYKDLKTDIQDGQIAYKQLSDSLARAQSELVTKQELKAFADNLEVDVGKIRTDLSSIDARLRAVGQTVASIKGKIEENQESDSSTPHDPPPQPEECELCDIHGYTAAKQEKDIKIGDMPHAKLIFDAASPTPWMTVYDDVDIKVNTIVGEKNNTNQLVFYHTISMVNKTRPSLVDKEFKLKVVTSEFNEVFDKGKEWYWWAPHLDLAVDNVINFGYNNGVKYLPGVSLGFSPIAYGRTVNDNDWRLIRLGVGINTNKKVYLTFEPVKYNLGRVVPIVSDMWLGIGATTNFSNWGLNISIGTTL